LLILALLTVIVILRAEKIEFSKKPKLTIQALGIGFIADFLDTLGIGSFLVTTSLFNFTKYLKNPRLLPGTLNVMHCLPTIVEALFFTKVVKVEALTFFSLVIAAMIGSFFGSKVISKFLSQKIKLIMSLAMLITSLLLIFQKIGLINFLSKGNFANGLTGSKLIIGIVGNFILGGLMSAGVGLYAPCMVMVYLLGMKPLAAFPIMMTSCAALMPVNVINFSREKMFQNQDLWLLIGGGICGVLVAAVFVKNLSMNFLTWIVILVGIYTSGSLAIPELANRKK
ncbi:MAG: sulfite exporter TauE/SafE family protein, partial [Lactobacillaceae bacterium]|jgi:uncharacterized membrane protein YfcA|nr:sulfite exporter TauE/SafE family protein [Lactobacillaceae bacterium]